MKVLLLFILLIGLIIYSKTYYSGNVLVLSKDGKSYFVNNRQSKADKIIAANKIADIRQRINQLIYAIKDNTNLMQRDGYKRLVSKWNSIEIEELNIDKSGVLAFNINKGERIGICLRNNEMNDIIFVLLHELAHIITKEVGHPKPFWDNYKELLEVAMQNDIYVYKDYNRNASKYCGHYLDSTPILNNNK